MPVHDEAKESEHKPEKTKSHHAKSEIEDIKENVVGLARNIRDVSTDKAHDAADYVRDRMDDVKATGTDTLNKIEKRIKAKPGQSVAIAFVTGLLASFLFGRRSS